MSEELKNKLINYEVAPPPAAWDAIASELRENNELIPLATRMQNVEIEPPVQAWLNISAALQNEKAGVDVVPMHKDSGRLFKIAFAAAAIGIIFLGSLFIFKNHNTPGKFIAKVPPVKKQVVPLNDTIPQVAPTNLPEQMLDNVPAPALIASRTTPRKKNKILRNAVVKRNEQVNIETAIYIPARPIRDESGNRIYDPELVADEGDEYVDVTGPNGEQTRISAKFLNALLYLNDDSKTEEYEGFFNKSFMESIIWSTRFQEWRNKILKASFIPSSSNFLDILEFKDLILKDKEQE
jgi:hypothetical protein